MLGRDERAAIFTLIRSILEARHGKQKLDEAMVAFQMMTGLMAGNIGKIVETAIPPEELEKLGRKIERSLKKKLPTNPK